MQFSEFVQAYHREVPPTHTATAGASLPAKTQRELDSIMGQARAHAERWGGLLHDCLSGRAIGISKRQLDAEAQAYLRWFAAAGDRLVALSVEIANEQAASDVDCSGGPAEGVTAPQQIESAKVLHALTEFSFHRLNARCLPMWSALLFDECTPRSIRRTVARARFELSSDVLLFSAVREQALGSMAQDDAETRQLRRWHTGMLTEIDAMIALLEVSCRSPQTVVLPAPPQFERFAGGANADMIVIDTAAHEVIGVQVKSSRSWRQADHYDARRVVMLDGVLHLENSRVMRTDARRSDRRAVSWPGLVGAHYLRALPVGRVEKGWATRRQALNMKIAARHYAGEMTDRNAEAFENCVRLVHQALGAGGATGVTGATGRMRVGDGAQTRSTAPDRLRASLA